MHHRYFLEKQKEIVNLIFFKDNKCRCFSFHFESVSMRHKKSLERNEKKLTDNLLPMPSWAAGSFSYHGQPEQSLESPLCICLNWGSKIYYMGL